MTLLLLQSGPGRAGAGGGAGPSFVTWDAATVAAVTLSGGNLIATNTGTTSPEQGARVVASAGKTSGKYYFECTFTNIAGGANTGFGIGTTASTYTNMGNGGTTGVFARQVSAIVLINGSNVLDLGSAWANGQVCDTAVDLDNRKIWFRRRPSTNWNASGTANPATNTEGLTIPAGTMAPLCAFGGSSGVANNVITANFGGSAFGGAVPSGFTSGWPS